MKVLHLSDLHLSAKHHHDEEIVLKAAIEAIEARREEKGAFDLVIFSGDLVHRGGDENVFQTAKSTFINRILDAAGVTESQLVICPGNHDIDREVVRKVGYIEAGLLKTLTNRSDINKFVDDHWSQPISAVPMPFERLSAFYRDVWSVNSDSCISTNLFLKAHILNTNDGDVGVACFNTAWRCTGEAGDVDKGNLILGERVVDHAIELLRSTRIKIGVFHHPLHWLNESDQVAVESRLQAEFDLLACGHIHRPGPELRKTTMGDAILSQAGCLYGHREWFNGYSIVETDSGDTATVRLYEYSDHRRKFLPATRVAEEGAVKYPFSTAACSSANTLSAVLRKARPNIRRLANDQIALAGTGEQARDIDEHFVCPPLGKLSQAIPAAQVVGTPETDRENLLSILKGKQNITIVGRSELGKTTIAHYMAVKISEGLGDQARLPLIGKFSEIDSKDGSLWRLFRSYANEVSDGSTTKAFVEGNPIFAIVDDVDLFDETRVKALGSLITNHDNVRWCLFVRAFAGSETFSKASDHAFPNTEQYVIGELRRGAIRALSDTYFVSKDEQDRRYQSLMEQLQRIGLPRSGYVVSLILWALKNRSQGELLNEAVLLQNLIDHILGRMDYTGALRREFDFTMKSLVLQNLAFHFKTNGEVQSKNEIVAFVIALLKRKGLRYDAAEIVRAFIKCGVLYEVSETLSFRYRRFQDFFLAGYLRDNPADIEDICKGERWLDFTKELDIYTARFRHEEQFLTFGQKIIEGIKRPEPPLTIEEVEDYLSKGQNLDFTQAQLRKMRKQPMTAEKIDELMDKADQRIAEKREKEGSEKAKTGLEVRSNRIIKFSMAVEMYSEFIRNLEFVDKEVKTAHLEHCLSCWETILRGFLSGLKEVIDDFVHDLENGGQGSSKAVVARVNKKAGNFAPERLAQLFRFIEGSLKHLMPTVVAEIAYQNLGSEKLVDFIDEQIRSEKMSAIRKLLCCFILLEVEAPLAISRISEFYGSEETPRWVTAVITQRLYSYYQQRPLAGKMRTNFEDLVVKLEMRLAGESRPRARGTYLSALKKKAFKEPKS
ncbi:metallophosphoesterase [Bradyrhizobium sp. WSM1743]|uniref:metallophosphoesterase family protein n=1 Tax=Bradyrhizobium sp. WSM1743 TaxID=318996 RepID=UPI0003F93FD3|nr:metallophosphoesterase [Bradyrhizobium sp. WSM1743]